MIPDAKMWFNIQLKQTCISMDGHEVPGGYLLCISLRISWKFKTTQSMVFGMIHGSRIPDPTNGQNLVDLVRIDGLNPIPIISMVVSGSRKRW